MLKFPDVYLYNFSISFHKVLINSKEKTSSELQTCPKSAALRSYWVLLCFFLVAGRLGSLLSLPLLSWCSSSGRSLHGYSITFTTSCGFSVSVTGLAPTPYRVSKPSQVVLQWVPPCGTSLWTASPGAPKGIFQCAPSEQMTVGTQPHHLQTSLCLNPEAGPNQIHSSLGCSVSHWTPSIS